MEGWLRQYDVTNHPPTGSVAGEDRLFEVAKRLISDPLDQAVSDSLRILGEGGEADRAWLFRYNQDATLFRNTHEWCRAEISHHADDLQDVPTAMIAWLHEFLSDGQAVMVISIEGLPRSAKALKAEFRRQEDKSVLSVPLFRDGRIWGCIGYDAVRSEKEWKEDEIQLLSRCGSLIVEAVSQASRESGAVEREGDLTMPTRTGNRRVGVKEILAVKAERDYTRVYFAGGSSLELRPLKTWLGLLPKGDFQRIHRGAIVNVRSVTGTRSRKGGGFSVIVDGLEDDWNVSRPYRAELRSRLGY